MRSDRLGFVVACVVALAITPRAVHAEGPPMSPAAAALWTEGQALYEQGRYADAIARFERGRAIEPRPEFLYAQGQAARKAGDCRRAIELYRRFIVEAKSPA